jgi:hypothetical protein
MASPKVSKYFGLIAVIIRHVGLRLSDADANPRRFHDVLLRLRDHQRQRQRAHSRTPHGVGMKYVGDKPFSDPEVAMKKILEIANSVDAVQDGRIHIEKVNGPFLFDVKGTRDQYLAGLKHAIERGWIVLHESGTFIRFTQAGADLFA